MGFTNRYKVMSVIAFLMRMKFSRFPAKDKSEKHFHQYVCWFPSTTKIIKKIRFLKNSDGAGTFRCSITARRA